MKKKGRGRVTVNTHTYIFFFNPIKGKVQNVKWYHTERVEDPDISEGDTPNDGAYSLNDKKKNMGDFGLQYLSFTYMKYFWGKWMSKSAIVNISIYCAVYMTKYNRLWIYIHHIYTRIFIYYLYHGLFVKFRNIIKVYKMQKNTYLPYIRGFFFCEKRIN